MQVQTFIPDPQKLNLKAGKIKQQNLIHCATSNMARFVGGSCNRKRQQNLIKAQSHEGGTVFMKAPWSSSSNLIKQFSMVLI